MKERNKMNKATIEITGLGPVQINTELKEVRLVRAFTVSGDYVNVVKKKVSRNKKHEIEERFFF